MLITKVSRDIAKGANAHIRHRFILQLRGCSLITGFYSTPRLDPYIADIRLLGNDQGFLECLRLFRYLMSCF